jgi:UPF0148 protein
MRRDDEIMAEYLLKGGKMLSKTCTACGSPLFEYKGETLCVVCAEQAREGEGAAYESQEVPVSPLAPAEPVTGQEPAPHPAPRPWPSALVIQAIEETLIDLCLRARQEQDPGQTLVLMKAIKEGAEVLAVLAPQGVHR